MATGPAENTALTETCWQAGRDIVELLAALYGLTFTNGANIHFSFETAKGKARNPMAKSQFNIPHDSHLRLNAV